MRIPELEIPYLQWQHMTHEQLHQMIQQTQEHLQQLMAWRQQLTAQQQQNLQQQQQLMFMIQQRQGQQQMTQQPQPQPQQQQQMAQQQQQQQMAQQQQQQQQQQMMNQQQQQQQQKMTQQQQQQQPMMNQQQQQWQQQMTQQQQQQQQQLRMNQQQQLRQLQMTQQQQQPLMNLQQQAAMLHLQRQIGQQQQVATSLVPSSILLPVRPQNFLQCSIIPQSQTPNQGIPGLTPSYSHPTVQLVRKPLSTPLQGQLHPHSTPDNLLMVNKYENSNPINSSSSNQQQQQQPACESSNSLMGGDVRQIFCKYCGQKCVKRTSDSTDNPGRVFWACPIKLGGHGWMEWEDYELPSDTKQNESMNEKVVRLEKMLQDLECELVECKIEKVRIT